MIGIGMYDPITFEPARLMYQPSCSSDSNYVYAFNKEAPAVSIDGLLNKYVNWRDVAAYLVVNKEKFK